jgi:hypothetical protein
MILDRFPHKFLKISANFQFFPFLCFSVCSIYSGLFELILLQFLYIGFGQLWALQAAFTPPP